METHSHKRTRTRSQRRLASMLLMILLAAFLAAGCTFSDPVVTATPTELRSFPVIEPPETTEAPTLPTPAPTAERTYTPDPDAHYVLNMNTRKFHHLWCSSVDEIKEQNRWDFTGTRDEVIAKGYVPCKRCNP